MADDVVLSEEEAALVFRRAAELEARAPDDRGGFDVTTLERIGAEAGLSPVALRQALGELRSGRLRPPAAVDRSGVPREVVVERRLRVGRAIVAETLETYLRRQQLRVCRRLGDVTIWELNRSFAASITRGVDVGDRIRLSRVDGVEMHVVAEGREGTQVRIVLDFTKVHRDARWGRYAGGAMALAGAAAGVVGVAVGAPEALLVVPPASAGAAGTYFGSRSSYAKHVKRAVDAVELALDELEHPRPFR